VPVVYRLTAGAAQVRVTGADGTVSEAPGDTLDAAQSRALFERRGAIAGIEVEIPERGLCAG
jgi:hypothetical protein